ncbi:WxL domain-containing protein [Lactococcus lactis subsp. lactis]|uniref:WxL domain-containing protein n=1 Tax=Lactococcus lactis TaxID=1358 RepID=UPI00223C45A4|nr:WxL domain-containing protein [Lactococcus lactis]MCT0016607.1 WxL domain-containing protein [Lactococcus lactis subsp. lactis]
MKKVITLSASTLALLVAGATGVSAVSAASVTATQWNSTGTVAFTENTTTPPDVTNPEVPGETGPGGTPGSLAIDYASDLDFGTHAISASQETYYANPDSQAFSKSVAAFVEMHDLRGLGTGNSTQLTVTQLAQFNNGSAELNGAALTFSSGTGVNAGGGSYVPTSVTEFTLTPGTAQNVMSTDGTAGQFLTSYGKASDYQGTETGGPISLSVPSGSAQAGNYTATLQWDLTTAP